MSILFNGYDYYIWATRDALPTVEVSDRIALKPHDSGDYRGRVIKKETKITDSGDITLGTVLMDINKREKIIEFKPNDARYVYRLHSRVDGLHFGRVLIVGETTDFRSCARSQVFSDDFVVEIGSSYGDTSVLLSRYVKTTVGFDIGNECVTEANRRYPDLTFIHACCFRNAEVVIEKSEGCNVVFIDIGGDRRVSDQLEILQWVKAHLHPQLIVQKSRKLYASLLLHSTEHGVLSGSAALPHMAEFMSREWDCHGSMSTNEKRRTSRSGKRKRQAAVALGAEVSRHSKE